MWGGTELDKMQRDKRLWHDRELLEFFWQEVKRRTLAKYATLDMAFRSVDTSGDRAISFLEFNGLLQSLGIVLEGRFGRYLFDRASGGDREISYEEYRQVLAEEEEVAPARSSSTAGATTMRNNRRKSNEQGQARSNIGATCCRTTSGAGSPGPSPKRRGARRESGRRRGHPDLARTLVFIVGVPVRPPQGAAGRHDL